MNADTSHYRWLSYSGRSMFPTFTEQDLLRVDTTAQINRGDVIVFRTNTAPERYIVHRVVAMHSDGLVTRGDNNRQRDPFVVPPEQVIGLVIERRRKGVTRRVRQGRRGYLSALCWHCFKTVRRRLSGIYLQQDSLSEKLDKNKVELRPISEDSIATIPTTHTKGRQSNTQPSRLEKLKELIFTNLFTGRC